MAKTVVHLCLDIEGGIRNAKDLKGVITVNGRTLMTVKEVREFLRYQLALGRRVLPMTECDNFDYQTGCRGHVMEDDAAAQREEGQNIKSAPSTAQDTTTP